MDSRTVKKCNIASLDPLVRCSYILEQVGEGGGGLRDFTVFQSWLERWVILALFKIKIHTFEKRGFGVLGPQNPKTPRYYVKINSNV